MTELEKAKADNDRIKELYSEIAKCREYQMSCKKVNDNIGDMVWAHKIKELKAERSYIDRDNRYIRLSIFTQVVKAYLTKDQYEDCWDRVEQVLERPELMKS